MIAIVIGWANGHRKSRITCVPAERHGGPPAGNAVDAAFCILGRFGANNGTRVARMGAKAVVQNVTASRPIHLGPHNAMGQATPIADERWPHGYAGLVRNLGLGGRG